MFVPDCAVLQPKAGDSEITAGNLAALDDDDDENDGADVASPSDHIPLDSILLKLPALESLSVTFGVGLFEKRKRRTKKSVAFIFTFMSMLTFALLLGRR